MDKILYICRHFSHDYFAEEFTICGMELDDRELYDLAEHISSDDVQHLAVELHGTVKGYRQIEHGCRARSSSLKDCVFEVLKQWHENQTTSPQECRKTLVQTLHRLGKCQLAAAVAAKDYTRLNCRPLHTCIERLY